ncbi:4'-phosphopantetheinyl transferase family protein [Lactococcus paracarnosus]|uniref:4'-phosphopantetheinyl transferase superfamily protein n=1 Tax=Pseudolactococcus paracarnosus TaxID=2749962 RepID=A0ABT0APE9_9LACT
MNGNTLFFNISHSGDWVVGTFSSFEIGIDIEEVKHLNIDIAENFFSAYEYRTLLSLENTKQLDYFYDIWTLKECYLKLLGTGLSAPLNSFYFNFDEKNIALINNDIDKKLYFKQYPFSKYKISVCSENNYFPEKIIEISIQDITF